MPNEKIETTAQLKFDPNNARKRTERSRDMIVKSLEQFGGMRSIVVDEDNTVRAGNGTLEAAQQIGIEKVRIIEADGNELIAVKRKGLTEEQWKQYAIADNRSSDLSEWDADVLAELVGEIDLSGFFSADELANFLPITESPTLEEDEAKTANHTARLRAANTGFSEDRLKELEMVAGYKTAIARTEMSTPMRYFLEKKYLVGDVLDYGCGFDVHAFARYDPAFAPDFKLLSKQWDTITCNYVLNVLPLEHNRVELLLTLKTLIKPKGTVLLAIWRKDNADTMTPDSFQCGWDAQEWQAFIAQFWQVEKLKVASFLGFRLKLN